MLNRACGLVLLLGAWSSAGCAAQTDSFEVCQTWTKDPAPVWEGYLFAADPCVVRDGDMYRMYFTAYLPEPDRSVIAVAESGDGLVWDWATPTDPENPVSIALDGRPGQWDQDLETNHVMRVGDEWWMFYTGKIHDPNSFVSPYEIGLAKSVDGLNWTRASNDPVLPLADSGPDNGAMTSEAVVEWNGVFYMIYLGWELDAQGGFVNFRISGASSSDPDGLAWTRHTSAVLTTPISDMPWVDAVVEPTLMQASDGMFYLFVTADDDESKSSPSNIAVLRSDHPFGPWEGCPTSIVRMTQPWEDNEIIAPHVMEDEGWLRMWYHGLTLNDPLTGERFRIGYAETEFPIRCYADTNNDGTLTPADFTAWIAAFNADATECDQNNDGACTPTDFTAWVDNYNTGCG